MATLRLEKGIRENDLIPIYGYANDDEIYWGYGYINDKTAGDGEASINILSGAEYGKFVGGVNPTDLYIQVLGDGTIELSIEMARSTTQYLTIDTSEGAADYNSKIYKGSSLVTKVFKKKKQVMKIYKSNTLVYEWLGEKPEPIIEVYNYQVADTLNDFDTDLRIPFAYSYDDKKWRVFNNSSQYEEYGIYEQTDDLSSITTYPNKLAVVGATEYQYQNNSWVEVGTYENSFGEVCELSSNMQGVQFPVNFAILKEDVQRMVFFDLTLIGVGYASSIDAKYDAMGGYSRYKVDSNGQIYNGTITTDDTYIYFNAPDDYPNNSIDVEMSQWWNEPITVYGGATNYSVKYDNINFDVRKGYYYKSFDDISDEIGYNLIVNVDGYIYKKQDEFIRANVNPYTDDNKVFSGDTTLTEIKLLDECITSIGNYAFYGCSGLTSITIPNSVKSIGIEAFSSCSSLTSITIPNSVTSIYYSAFAECTSLSSITIPNNVTSIGTYAFYGCSSLTSVTIGNSVTSISTYAFKGCVNIQEIYFLAVNAPTGSQDAFGDLRTSTYSGQTDYCGYNAATPKIYYPSNGVNYNTNTKDYTYLYIASVGRDNSASVRNFYNISLTAKGFGFTKLTWNPPST